MRPVSSSYYRHLDTMNRRQRVEQAAPLLAAVAPHPQLPRGRAEVERGGLEVVDGHAVALDGEEALFLRQATSQPAPGIAAVLAAPDRGRAAGTGARPALQRHDVNRIGVVRMDDDGEAEVGRQPLGDRAPGVAVVVAAQDADARTF